MTLVLGGITLGEMTCGRLDQLRQYLALWGKQLKATL